MGANLRKIVLMTLPLTGR